MTSRAVCEPGCGLHGWALHLIRLLRRHLPPGSPENTHSGFFGVVPEVKAFENSVSEKNVCAVAPVTSGPAVCYAGLDRQTIDEILHIYRILDDKII